MKENNRMDNKFPHRPAAGRLRQPVQLLALAGLLAFSTASHAGLFSDSEARAQINSVAQDTTNMKAQMQSQDSDLQRQIDSLKQELAQLRGQEDTAAHNLNSVQRRQRDIYIDLNNRLQTAEKAAQTPASAPAPAIHAAAVPEVAEQLPQAHVHAAKVQVASEAAHPTQPATASKGAQQAYDAAFNLVQLQDRKAIPSLQRFVKTYPDSPLAASAQYWMGYLYYSKGFFKRAAAIQEQLIQRYPDSNKVPHAMYNLALCRLHLKDHTGAQKMLSQLAEKYPTSTDARLARKRLAEMSPTVASND
jgi:tol-pal system protein YbgF